MLLINIKNVEYILNIYKLWKRKLSIKLGMNVNS